MPDDECLPREIDPRSYHKRLLREAQEIFNQFVSDRSSFLVIAQSGFSLQGLVDRIVQHGVSPEFLSRVEACSPSTASLLWGAVKSGAENSLNQMAERLGLERRRAVDGASLLADLTNLELNPFFAEPNLLLFAQWLFSLSEDEFDPPLTPWGIECGLEPNSQGDQFGRIDPKKFKIRKSGSAGIRLFTPPAWCETPEERQRYQIGALLRYAIRGTVDFFARASNSKHHTMPRYARSISHWEQQRYSAFQGRSAFGPPWLPISSFTEDLLYDLLRWPGSGILSPGPSLTKIRTAIESRKELGTRYGTHSGTIFLEQSAPYPQKGFIDWGRPLRIGVVQTVIPKLEDYVHHANAPDLSGDPSFRLKHRAHLAAALEGVNQMRRLRDTHLSGTSGAGQTIDLLIFPELAVHPADVGPLLMPFARKHQCILLFGMVYHEEPLLAGSPLINSCQWLIPDWTENSGFQLRTIEQGKLHLTTEENKLLKSNAIGFRPAQWLIEYQWSSNKNHRPLRMSASVCYDATDLALAADLRSRNDLYIVCALNRDVGTFDRMSEALHYHMYQGVILVNNGEFGGSSFFMPFDKPYRRQVFHFHGQPQVAIGFAEICPEKLVNRPNPKTVMKGLGAGDSCDSASPKTKWKTPPAGWRNLEP